MHCATYFMKDPWARVSNCVEFQLRLRNFWICPLKFLFFVPAALKNYQRLAKTIQTPLKPLDFHFCPFYSQYALGHPTLIGCPIKIWLWIKSHDQLIDFLITWLIDRLIIWQTDWQTDKTINSSTDWLMNSLTSWLTAMWHCVVKNEKNPEWQTRMTFSTFFVQKYVT